MNQTVRIVRDKLDKVMHPTLEYDLGSFIVLSFETISSSYPDSIQW
jgi:hypothetical protein